jgi:hypothetical protein
MPPKIVSLVAAAVTLLLPSIVLAFLVRPEREKQSCGINAYLSPFSLPALENPSFAFRSLTIDRNCAFFGVTLFTGDHCTSLLDRERLHFVQDDALDVDSRHSHLLCWKDSTGRDEKGSHWKAHVDSSIIATT